VLRGVVSWTSFEPDPGLVGLVSRSPFSDVVSRTRLEYVRDIIDTVGVIEATGIEDPVFVVMLE
jgi:hypothetical protein